MRWLRNIFALLAIVCVVLWVASHELLFSLSVPLGDKGEGLGTQITLGKVMVTIQTSSPPDLIYRWHIDIERLPERDMRDWDYLVNSRKIPNNWTTFGFDQLDSRLFPGRVWKTTQIAFPLWLPTLLFSLWPAIALTRHIKRRYFTAGICRKCGYDLRGSPSGVCPECGRSPRKEKTPAKAEV